MIEIILSEVICRSAPWALPRRRIRRSHEKETRNAGRLESRGTISAHRDADDPNEVVKVAEQLDESKYRHEKKSFAKAIAVGGRRTCQRPCPTSERSTRRDASTLAWKMHDRMLNSMHDACLRYEAKWRNVRIPAAWLQLFFRQEKNRVSK